MTRGFGKEVEKKISPTMFSLQLIMATAITLKEEN